MYFYASQFFDEFLKSVPPHRWSIKIGWYTVTTSDANHSHTSACSSQGHLDASIVQFRVPRNWQSGAPTPYWTVKASHTNRWCCTPTSASHPAAPLPWARSLSRSRCLFCTSSLGDARHCYRVRARRQGPGCWCFFQYLPPASCTCCFLLVLNFPLIRTLLFWIFWIHFY